MNFYKRTIVYEFLQNLQEVYEFHDTNSIYYKINSI